MIRALTVAILVCWIPQNCPAQVILRQSRRAIEAVVVTATADGVSVDSTASSPEGGPEPTHVIIGWDQVLRVDGDWASRAAPFVADGDILWRARTRLARSDWRSAEPLLEPMAVKYAGANGPTASLIFEGVTRCRLARGSQTSSVWSWLELARIRDVTDIAASERARWLGGTVDGLPELVDGQTGLCPALPPMWLSGPAVMTLADDSQWDRYVVGPTRSGDPAVLASLYRAAAELDAGRKPSIPDVAAAGPAATLIAEVCRARAGSDAERAEARSALAARIALAETPPWVECWCRAGLGRSLLREADASARRRGVLELLHVHVRFGVEHPYLAGLALAESAVALHEIGDDASARSLRDELVLRYPRHPGLAWAPLATLNLPEPERMPARRQERDDEAP